MCCFTTNLSYTLLVKEFLKLVNIWRSYGQDYGVLCFLTKCRRVHCPRGVRYMPP